MMRSSSESKDYGETEYVIEEPSLDDLGTTNLPRLDDLGTPNWEFDDSTYSNESRTFIVDASTSLVIKWGASGVDIKEAGLSKINEDGWDEKPEGAVLVERGAEGQLKLRLTVKTLFTIEGGESGEGRICWKPSPDDVGEIWEPQKQVSYDCGEGVANGYSRRCSDRVRRRLFRVNLSLHFSLFDRQQNEIVVKDQAKTEGINIGNFNPDSNDLKGGKSLEKTNQNVKRQRRIEDDDDLLQILLQAQGERYLSYQKPQVPKPSKPAVNLVQPPPPPAQYAKDQSRGVAPVNPSSPILLRCRNL
ncbi:hypothetical protein NE237_001308 [Protea cynaroides]|uniref:Uncharacterized protein n=1 Tax=Protea cynaroides TaxID=273540 RepID=A0A9Q0KT36_9MAGN|nr:hypothetical protein NE237_001308 [Protea cynaroides]